jgi:hypothetical protein
MISDDEIAVAKNRFQANISNGIAVLVLKHGYSRARAVALILDQIRQTDAPPSDDEVFRVMHNLGLGFEAATQSMTVANALKRLQNENGYTRAKAINYLSSCLTTMKLLGSVERTKSENTLYSSTVNSSSSTNSLITMDSPSSSSIVSSCSSQTMKSSHPRPRTGRRNSSKNNLKHHKSSRLLSKPPKPQKKRKEENIIASTNDGSHTAQSNVEKAIFEKEQEVVQQITRSNNKTPSPNVARGKRMNAHREHDVMEVNAQPSKRQRLDSI